MHGVHLVAASPNLSSKTLEEMKRLVIYKPRLLPGEGESGAHTQASWGLHRQLKNKAALCPVTVSCHNTQLNLKFQITLKESVRYLHLFKKGACI